MTLIVGIKWMYEVDSNECIEIVWFLMRFRKEFKNTIAKLKKSGIL